MNICFSIGPKSKNVISSISKTVDNAEFFTYGSIKDLIKDAKLRHIDFKRIIISTKIVGNPAKEFANLSEFLGEFSNSTEVVLITGKDAVGTADVEFNKYFNAPLYTPVVLQSATSKVLLELVLGDVDVLSMKYYDVAPAKSSEKSSEPANQPTVNPEPPKEEVKQEEKSSYEIGSGPKSIDVSNMGSSGREQAKPVRETEENYGFSNNGSAPEREADFSGYDDEDFEDELGIGDYGEMHTDTGYLDEEGEEELSNLSADNATEPQPFEDTPMEEPLTGKASNISGYSGYEPPTGETFEETPVEEPEPEPEEEEEVIVVRRRKRVKSDTKLDLVISTRSYRATKSIVEEAYKLYCDDDAKVLVIDLDYKSNRVLSYLKTDEFYSSNSFDGITKQRIYEEDHVSICSNGYGSPIKTEDLKSLLDCRAVQDYDLVLIDCPVDCLDIIDKELIDMFHILVFAGGGKHDLAEMSLGLVNRSYVNLYVERVIMNNCIVEIDDGVRKEDLNAAKKECLFANGSWLNKIVDVVA